MPKKYFPKYMRKKKGYKNKYKPRQVFRPKKGLTRSVVPFTREAETTVRLDTLAGLDDGAGTYISMVRANKGIVGRIRIRLNNLPNYSDFTNLFKEYKLNYLKLTFIPAGNIAATTAYRNEEDGATVQTLGNKNVLIRTCLNRTGDVPDTNNDIPMWNQLQAKKQWVLAQDKPTTITCKLNQLKVVERGTGLNSTALSKPTYLSTNNVDINHYGLDVRFDSIDGTAINSANGDIWPKFRVISKVYFTCRGVA